MPRPRERRHDFRDKLLLNQWLLSRFGLDPLPDGEADSQAPRPFRQLADLISHPSQEGLGSDDRHGFYHALNESAQLLTGPNALSKDQLLGYEDNIVRHTRAINAKRSRTVVWKYYQWLTLLFVEIYLDRFFADRAALLADLNGFVGRFNEAWPGYADVPPYEGDDLNKICLQNATGSGKTLLMHVNLLQYRHYAERQRRGRDLSRVILITPNEQLSEQHLAEFQASGISALSYAQHRGGIFGGSQGLGQVDVLEIQKLADQDGPNTIATRSLGDQNLLLVDEGHRGTSGKEEGVWFSRRAQLAAKGFAFEYSATFEQAVRASGDLDLQDSYAKAVIFDYSYRWFYEDGFGKDYQILNLPRSPAEMEAKYMTACLLKFYQQLRIYEEGGAAFQPFNIEKPLWVFVGNTVKSASGGGAEKVVVTDVGRIVQFIAGFLDGKQAAKAHIQEILTGDGQDTGLLDSEGNDIFANAFDYLAKAMEMGKGIDALYQDIMARLFNHPAGGRLTLVRLKGESGEVALRAGTAEEPFGLINVGDAKGLCDHLEEAAAQGGMQLKVEASDFTESIFGSVKESSSKVNLLIGSKKFIEGWDCWRVSTMGLMHVGQSEGAQIIQLFGRGVRLKGHNWSLKRSGKSQAVAPPKRIEQLETLNVFGIEANYMQKFRAYLQSEGLPGNERTQTLEVPLTVKPAFLDDLRILRPKQKAADGEEYDFLRDGPSPTLGEAPDALRDNGVVVNWYPRIQSLQSGEAGRDAAPNAAPLESRHLAFLDCDQLFLDLERFKNERGWHNLNITRKGIVHLLGSHDWYTLYLPPALLEPANFDRVLLLQEVARELLKRYCERYYNHCKRKFIEPRLELRRLTSEDPNIPQETAYQLKVDASRVQLAQAIKKVIADLDAGQDTLGKTDKVQAVSFAEHLYHPLLHVRGGEPVTVHPPALNDGEFQFVADLKQWWTADRLQLKNGDAKLCLLRNQSRGKGVGFFEAGNFHPDFILWLLKDGKQYITFIDPHGLGREGPASPKIQFHQQIKEVEARLKDPSAILNSFILSRKPYRQVQNWGKTQAELEAMHVLFMPNTAESSNYSHLDRLFKILLPQ